MSYFRPCPHAGLCAQDASLSDSRSEFVKREIAAFGGNPNAVTLAGQSSGADLIKTLLSVPSADSLFQRAILHSAPLNYADDSPKTSQAVGQAFLNSLGCVDSACLQNAKVSDILAAQDTTFMQTPQYIEDVSASEPIRPYIDGQLVQQPLVKLANGKGLSNKNRQIIFTTVKDEAGPTIASVSQDQVIPREYYEAYIHALMDPDRAGKVVNSKLYALDLNNQDAAREQLELLGTDWIWRCINQQVAVNLTAHGQRDKVWIAEFDAGISYPSNQGIAFCKGRVCHQGKTEQPSGPVGAAG